MGRTRPVGRGRRAAASHEREVIVRGGGYKIALADVHHFFQPTPLHAAGVTDMGERPPATYAAELLEFATLLARFKRRRLA